MAAKHDACQGGVCKVICCSNINLSPFTVYTFWVDALLDYQPPNSAPKFTKPSEKIFVRTGDAGEQIYDLRKGEIKTILF